MPEAKFGETRNELLYVDADLTGATAVTVRLRSDAGAVTDTTATISNPATGEISVPLSGTLAVGEYDMDIRITIAGKLVIVPTVGFSTFTVYPAL